MVRNRPSLIPLIYLRFLFPWIHGLANLRTSPVDLPQELNANRIEIEQLIPATRHVIPQRINAMSQ